MTPQELRAALADEIRNDPADLGYGPFISDAPGRITELLNEPARASMPATRLVSARTVLAETGALGALALSAMEAFDEAGPGEGPTLEARGLHAVVHWAMRFVTSNDGIDVGHPTTHQMLDALVLAGVIEQPMADALRGMSVQPCSRFALLAGNINARVREEDVRAAIALPVAEG